MTLPPIHYGPMSREERYRRNLVWLKAFRDASRTVSGPKAIIAANKAEAALPLPKPPQ